MAGDHREGLNHPGEVKTTGDENISESRAGVRNSGRAVAAPTLMPPAVDYDSGLGNAGMRVEHCRFRTRFPLAHILLSFITIFIFIFIASSTKRPRAKGAGAST